MAHRAPLLSRCWRCSCFERAVAAASYRPRGRYITMRCWTGRPNSGPPPITRLISSRSAGLARRWFACGIRQSQQADGGYEHHGRGADAGANEDRGQPTKPGERTHQIERVVRIKTPSAGISPASGWAPKFQPFHEQAAQEHRGAADQTEWNRPGPEPGMTQTEADRHEEGGIDRGIRIIVVAMTAGTHHVADPRQLAVR